MPKNSDDDADFVAGGVFWATLLAIGLSVGGLGWFVGGGIACVMALVTWVWVGTMTESRERNQAMLREIKEEQERAGLLQEAVKRDVMSGVARND